MKKFYKVLLTAMIGVFVLLQCGCTQSISFKIEYDKGLKAYNDKDFDAAIVNLNSALKYNPDSYSTYCLLGTSYGYKNDTKNAHRVLLEAVKKFPEEWNAYIFLGDIERTSKNYPSALEYYEKAVGLASMPEETRVYYRKMIDDVKKEKSKWNIINSEPQEARLAKILQEKKDSRAKAVRNQEALTKKTEDKVSPSQDPVQLDWTIWENSYTVSNNSMSVIEYGKKGEDVRNLKWTELVTIQHFLPESVKNQTTSAYLDSHLKPIQEVAKNAQKTFAKKIISETPEEIIYEWSFDNGSESEISRVLNNEKGIYHFHYSKKGPITPEEKAKWLSVLKNAKAN